MSCPKAATITSPDSAPSSSRYAGAAATADAWVAYTEEQSHEPARWVQRQVDATRMPVALRASLLLMHVEAIALEPAAA